MEECKTEMSITTKYGIHEGRLFFRVFRVFRGSSSEAYVRFLEPTIRLTPDAFGLGFYRLILRCKGEAFKLGFPFLIGSGQYTKDLFAWIAVFSAGNAQARFGDQIRIDLRAVIIKKFHRKLLF